MFNWLLNKRNVSIIIIGLIILCLSAGCISEPKISGVKYIEKDKYIIKDYQNGMLYFSYQDPDIFNIILNEYLIENNLRIVSLTAIDCSSHGHTTGFIVIVEPAI